MMREIFQKIAKLLQGKYIEKIVYRVIKCDKEVLKDYSGSLHWFLTCLVDTGKIPKGAIYIGTQTGEKIIEAFYDKRMTDEQTIERFLNEHGIEVERMMQ